MTTVEFLYALQGRSERCTADLLLPVRCQEEDERAPKPRAATVYLMRLPEMKKPEKKAPYILHAFVGGEDRETDKMDGIGARSLVRHRADTIEIRSVFCVYAPDRQEGGLYLLELMDRVRRDLLDYPVIGGFQLELGQALERVVYDSDEWDLGPYAVGGMVSRWTERVPDRPEVTEILRGDKGPGKIPGLYSEAKKFLEGASEHGE